MKKMAVMDYTMSAIFIPHYSDFCYFVQKARVNRISTVNSSRRPINMSMARIHLHISGIAGIIAKERVAVRTVHFQRIEIGIAEIKFIQLHTQSLTQTIVEVIPAAGAAVFH